jgi:hypothetical protein
MNMNFKLSNPALKGFLFPAVLVLLNFCLKGIFIHSGDISGDEPFTIYYSQVDFGTLLEMLKTENNPPFFFLLMHFWINFSVFLPFQSDFYPYCSAL